jgi:hypothetical protein
MSILFFDVRVACAFYNNQLFSISLWGVDSAWNDMHRDEMRPSFSISQVVLGHSKSKLLSLNFEL